MVYCVSNKKMCYRTIADGIFMFLGMLQFWFAQGIFGNVGLAPTKEIDLSDAVENNKDGGTQKVSDKVQRDRYTVVGILAIFTVFFWAAFEQAGGSMTIFAADYTNRVLEGDSALIFRIANKKSFISVRKYQDGYIRE